MFFANTHLYEPHLPEPPLSEPVYVPDVLVTGLADMRDLGALVRVSLYCDRPAIGRMPAERIIVANLVMPTPSLHAMHAEVHTRLYHLT